MLTPKLQAAVHLAHNAAHHTLNRCRGGWYDRSRHASPQGAEVVTTRTANALVDMGLAEYDDDTIPSALSLTHAGMDAAQAAGQTREAA